MKRIFAVSASWDDKAQVWVAESDDVPGLATEAATSDELIVKLKVLVSELLEANGAPALEAAEPSGLQSVYVNSRRESSDKEECSRCFFVENWGQCNVYWEKVQECG